MSEIKVEQVARPGSVDACVYPFEDMKVNDKDSFFVEAEDMKQVASKRNHVSSVLYKMKQAGRVDEDFSLASLIVKAENDSIKGVRFWKTAPKNNSNNSKK